MAVLRVREPFSCDIAGTTRVYRQGDLLDSSDPVATPQRVAMFLEPVEEAARRSVSATYEQATAAPNERRNLPPRKKAETDG
jgi:hypothetical protein